MRKIVAQTLFRWLSNSFILCALGGVAGCVAAPPPYEDYAIARTAVLAAKEVDSARFASALWLKAEENFREGERAYKNSDFGEAQKLFRNASDYAERAENITRLKKFQSGDSFP